jgi:hypothetical protein
MFIFFCATDGDPFPFLSTTGLCPHCGCIHLPMLNAETNLPVIAASARWRELLAAMQFEPADLHELEEVD